MQPEDITIHDDGNGGYKILMRQEGAHGAYRTLLDTADTEEEAEELRDEWRNGLTQARNNNVVGSKICPKCGGYQLENDRNVEFERRCDGVKGAGCMHAVKAP